MSNWGLRLRRGVSGQFVVIVAGLVVLAALAGWLTYGVHVEPGTHTEQREVSSWSTTADFTHEATVTESNPVYPVGTTLTNRTVYFVSAAPILNGTLGYEYDASEGGNLTVTTDAWLTFQQVSRDRDREIETVYWQSSRGLEQRRITGVEPGEETRTPFSFNVSKLANQSERIEEELGRTPGQTEAIVHVDVAINGTINGQRVSRTDQYALPVVVGEAYRVRNPDATSATYTKTEPVTVENTYGPLRTAGAPLLFGVSLLALVGLAVAWSRDRLALSPEERAYLTYRDDRADFDEWINAFRLPEDARMLPRAEADSLADLVDFAIDTDNSVVEDPDEGTYHVVHDGYQYIYVPPSPPERRGLAPLGTGDGYEDRTAETDDDGPTETDDRPGEEGDGAAKSSDESGAVEEPPRTDD